MMRTPPARRPLATLILAGLLVPGSVLAADPSDDIDAKIARLSELVERQQSEIDRLRREVLDLQLAQQRGRGFDAVAQESGAGAPAPPAPQQPTPAPPPADASPPEEGLKVGQAQQQAEPRRSPSEEAIVSREHAPLFERRFSLDTGFSYSYYDRRQLTLTGFLALDAIFLGKINLDQSKSSLYTMDVTGRYGLSDRISLDLNVPYVYRDNLFISAGAGGASTSLSEVSRSASGLGDISAAVYYQLIKESATWPDIVASLRVKSDTGKSPFGIKLVTPDATNNNLIIPEDLPTGTGIWSASVNLSALRTYDPVVLFGSVGYAYNRPTDFDDISPVQEQVVPARVELGNAIQFSAGLALALNDRASLSASYSMSTAGATHTRVPGQAEQRVIGSSTNTAVLNLGASYVLNPRFTMNATVSHGLTPDAPNMVFGLRGSYAF